MKDNEELKTKKIRNWTSFSVRCVPNIPCPFTKELDCCGTADVFPRFLTKKQKKELNDAAKKGHIKRDEYERIVRGSSAG